jgi:hypothetical protein
MNGEMIESEASMNPSDDPNAGPPSRTAVGATRPSTLPLALQKLRESVATNANALFTRSLDAIDDALFNFSEKSESMVERSAYMDSMRSLRLGRNAIEQTFREQLDTRFREFLRHGGRMVKVEETTLDANSLALVEEGDLEEDLATSGMAAKGLLRHNSALFALQQRLAVLLGTGHVDIEAIPFGPKAVCESLRAVVGRIEADITVRLVALKIFDRHLVMDLDQVYDDANRLLAQAGVLPNIRYQPPPRAPREGDSASSRVADAVAAATGSADGGSTEDTNAPAEPLSAEASELLSALASLLDRRRGSMRGERPVEAGPVVQKNELIHALSQLQSRRSAELDPEFATLSPMQQVERVKQDLIDQLRRSGFERAEHRVETADEDAIDLVGMLFQFVVQDRSLPAEIQAVLSRLQIPYVRVAIKDRHLFAQRTHPARVLLDSLAGASVGWSREADRDGRLLGALTETVERVVTEYADDPRLFETLDAHFRSTLERQRKLSEVAEQRAADVALGREKLALARRTANALVNTKLETFELPPLAREVIVNPWTNYLVLTHLRHGAESNEWRSATSFVDAVIWASKPKTTEQDFARLATLVPQMQSLLRHGLGMVGFGDQDTQRLSQGFVALFDSLHQREVALDQAETIAAAERSLENLPTAPVVDADPGGETEAASALAEDDEYLQRVRDLKVGTWIEFAAEGTTPERAKVSWISPFSARLLFVNRKGLKVAERSVYTLAGELRSGSAQVLEVAPIFERALNSIMSRLKYEHLLAGGGPQGPTPT